MAPLRVFHFIIAFLAPHIVHGYIYQAITMYEKDGKMTCDPIHTIDKSKCKHQYNAIGRVCDTNRSGNYIVNAYSQRCNIETTICDMGSDAKYGKCALYSGCYTVTESNRACSCMPGFFGNPYVQCFKQCATDLDCPSPYAVCQKGPNETVKRCKCKKGCDGDGVICTPKNKCKEHTAGTEEHRRCLQIDVDATRFVCDEGYYLDTNFKCTKVEPIKENQRVSVIADKFEDGSRIDIGKCFSMIINKDGESNFYQLNSGDAVTIKKKLVTSPQFYFVFEIKKSDIIGFGLLEDDKTKLTKLFTVSNSMDGCLVDGVVKYGPNGVHVTPAYVEVKVATITEETKAPEEPKMTEEMEQVERRGDM